MKDDDMLTHLRGLARVEMDALQLLGAALQHAKDPILQQGLETFRDVHRVHARALDAQITRMGGSPLPLAPDAKGRVLERIAELGALMGDGGLLVALVGGEELVHKRYQALLEQPWPEEVKPLLESQGGAIARQLAFFRGELDRRVSFADLPPASAGPTERGLR